MRDWLSVHQDLLRRAERAQRDSLRGQAAAPERLILLQRYLREIERSIDRKLRSLEPR
jgi:hypothetical protein